MKILRYSIVGLLTLLGLGAVPRPSFGDGTARERATSISVGLSGRAVGSRLGEGFLEEATGLRPVQRTFAEAVDCNSCPDVTKFEAGDWQSNPVSVKMSSGFYQASSMQEYSRVAQSHFSFSIGTIFGGFGVDTSSSSAESARTFENTVFYVSATETSIANLTPDGLSHLRRDAEACLTKWNSDACPETKNNPDLIRKKWLDTFGEYFVERIHYGYKVAVRAEAFNSDTTKRQEDLTSFRAKYGGFFVSAELNYSDMKAFAQSTSDQRVSVVAEVTAGSVSSTRPAEFWNGGTKSINDTSVPSYGTMALTSPADVVEFLWMMRHGKVTITPTAIAADLRPWRTLLGKGFQDYVSPGGAADFTISAVDVKYANYASIEPRNSGLDTRGSIKGNDIKFTAEYSLELKADLTLFVALRCSSTTGKGNAVIEVLDSAGASVGKSEPLSTKTKADSLASALPVRALKAGTSTPLELTLKPGRYRISLSTTDATEYTPNVYEILFFHKL